MIFNRGRVGVCDRRNLFVIDNYHNGFDLYKLDDCKWLRTYATDMAYVAKPKQVSFGEQGRAIVGGSDHGSVYVFDRKTGGRLDILPHAKGGMVQTITVRS
jgi:hypothetical protein